MTKNFMTLQKPTMPLVEFRLIGEIEGVHGEAEETQRIVLLKPTFHAKEYGKPRN